MANLSQEQMEVVQNLEIEMMADMYNRMSSICRKKCIGTSFKDGELAKAECVCLDRCVSKYLEVHDRIGKKLTSMTQADQAAMDAAKSGMK